MVYFPVTSFFFFKTSWDHNSNHFPDNNMKLFIKCIKSKDSHNYKSYRSLKVYLKSLELLLVQVEVCLNGASYCTTYHGVVADAEEAYHFYVYSPHNLTSYKYSSCLFYPSFGYKFRNLFDGYFAVHQFVVKVYKFLNCSPFIKTKIMLTRK